MSVESYIEILTTSLLSFNQMFIDGVTYEGVISSVMLFVCVMTVPLIIYWTIKYKKGDETFAKRFATYFDEFKEGSISHALYYQIFYMRRLFYAIGMIYFEDYPLLQVIVNTSFSVILVLYLLIRSCLLYTSPSPRDS